MWLKGNFWFCQLPSVSEGPNLLDLSDFQRQDILHWWLRLIYAVTQRSSHFGAFIRKSPSQFRWPAIQQILFFGCATQHAGSLFLQQGIKPALPALGTWSLNHWTVRKVPNRHLFCYLLETPWSKLCTHLLCSAVSGPMMAISYPGSSGTKCCLFQCHDMPCEQQLLDAYSTLS